MNQCIYPLSEQVNFETMVPSFRPLFLDGRGFTAVELLAHDPRRPGRKGGKLRFEFQVVAGCSFGSAVFDGPLLHGTVLGTQGATTSHIIVARKEHEKEARDRLGPDRLPDVLGLVDGDELVWCGPSGAPTFDNECARHLLELARRHLPTRIAVGSLLRSMLNDVAVSMTVNSMLVGPLVVDTNPLFIEDAVTLTLPNLLEPALATFFAPGLDELERSTYISLRHAGLLRADAVRAATLISA